VEAQCPALWWMDGLRRIPARSTGIPPNGSRIPTRASARGVNDRGRSITHKDEALRIVSDELFARAQRRTRLGGDQRLKSGGKPKYLLSGLLECGVCGAHYIMSDPRSYACSGHIGGHTCTNTIRVRRDQAEAVILGPIRRELLAPERVERMANEIAQLYAEKARARSSRAVRAPQELQDLDARITRLRERLRRGDPDMTADELQAAIDRAEQKRRELLELDEATAQPVKVASVLPRAADALQEADCRGPGRRHASRAQSAPYPA
jgi:site-specific DNA recombinase